MINTENWEKLTGEERSQRERLWPVYLKWLTVIYSSDEDYDTEAKLRSAREFYENGLIDDFKEAETLKGVGFRPALALYPGLSEAAVRELLNYPGFRNQHLKGAFSTYYLMRPRYAELIDSGVLTEEFMMIVLRGVYGKTLSDAAAILDFDLPKQRLRISYDLGERLIGFAFSAHGEQLTADTANHMLPFYLEALSSLSESESEECGFVLGRLVKGKTKFYDKGEGATANPARKKFVEAMLKGIRERWEQMNPITKEKLKTLFE